MNGDHRLAKVADLLGEVTRVVYADVPADLGFADEDGDVPAQRDYFCVADVDGAPRCLATVTAVDAKVLCVIPHAGSGVCSRCEYVDAANDGQTRADALLRGLVTSLVPIVPIEPSDEAVCRDPAPELCPDCRRRARSGSERPMDRPS